jgi:hypothetical protein
MGDLLDSGPADSYPQGGSQLMTKKLSLLLAAVAVLAFAVPAFASASTGLTENGKLIATGQLITFTNIGEVTITSEKLGNEPCRNVMLEAELVTNTTSEVKATKGGTQSASTCTRSGAEVKVFGIELNELKTTGGGTGTISLAFKIELNAGGTVCSYVGTNITFTYTPGSDVIRIASGALSVTPLACGKSASLDGEFTMTTRVEPEKGKVEAGPAVQLD